VWRGGGNRDAGSPSAGADAVGAAVEAVFIDADGTVRREPISRCSNVAFERGTGVVIDVRPDQRIASCGQRRRGDPPPTGLVTS
jgi:hypothetical protein